jgi:hypothetical protein
VLQPGWKASNFGREGSQGRGFVSFSLSDKGRGKEITMQRSDVFRLAKSLP